MACAWRGPWRRTRWRRGGRVRFVGLPGGAGGAPGCGELPLAGAALVVGLGVEGEQGAGAGEPPADGGGDVVAGVGARGVAPDVDALAECLSTVQAELVLRIRSSCRVLASDVRENPSEPTDERVDDRVPRGRGLPLLGTRAWRDRSVICRVAAGSRWGGLPTHRRGPFHAEAGARARARGCAGGPPTRSSDRGRS